MNNCHIWCILYWLLKYFYFNREISFRQKKKYVKISLYYQFDFWTVFKTKELLPTEFTWARVCSAWIPYILWHKTPQKECYEIKISPLIHNSLLYVIKFLKIYIMISNIVLTLHFQQFSLVPHNYVEQNLQSSDLDDRHATSLHR